MFYRSHARVSLDCGDEMVTKQSHKAECDIHNILRQYQRTGIVTHVMNARPSYGDLPSITDFQEAIHLVMSAEDAFGRLPAQVRDAFQNDPAQLLAALSDPAQADRLREFGLLKPVATGAPAPSEAPPAPSGS